VKEVGNMSLCVTIQCNGLTFVGTDTAVSNKVDGKTTRVGNVDKFFQLKDNSGVFLSGNVAEANVVLRYLKSLVTIDKTEIEQGLIRLRDMQVIKNKFGIVLVQYNKTILFHSKDDFKPIVLNNPTHDLGLDIQGFSMRGVTARKKTKEYINNHKNVTEKIIYQAILEGFKSAAHVEGSKEVICAGVGGYLNLHMITKDGFKKLMTLKVDDLTVSKESQLEVDKVKYQANGQFTVDNQGNVVAKSITIDGTGEIDFRNIAVRNLRVGEQVTMSPSAVISYQNLPSDIVDESSMKSYVDANRTVLPSYLTSTKITQTTIESPYIMGADILGSRFWQMDSYQNKGVAIQDGKVALLDSNQQALGGMYTLYEEGKEKFYMVSNTGSPLKIFSGENMSISAAGGYKIYQGNTQFTGDVLDKNGQPIGSGATGKLVFG
jgi:hypothetical protein